MVSMLDRARLTIPVIFGWMLAGNIVYAGSQWAILTIIARLGTPALVGDYVLALAITVPIMSLFTLQVRNVQATDASREYQFGDYLALQLVTQVAALVVTMAVAAAIFQREAMLCLVFAVSLMTCTDGLSDTAYGLFQQRELQERIANSKILRGVFSAIMVGMVMSHSRRVDLAILAAAAVRFCVFFGADLRNVGQILRDQPRHCRPRWSLATLSSLGMLTAPLGAVTMLLVLNNNIPRYFVAKDVGQSLLGIFGAVGYIPAVGTMAIATLCETVTPRLSRAFAHGDQKQFFRSWVSLMGVGLVLGVAGIFLSIVAGPQILTMFYGAEYSEHGVLLIWTMVASTVAYLALIAGCGLTAARMFHSQLPLIAVVITTNSVACYWLVPWLALKGAALSQGLSAVVQLFGTVGILCYECKTRKAQLDYSPLDNERIVEST